MKKIAVLGMGAMGSRIAQNFLKAKYSIVVYNRTAERAKPLLNQGAVYASTPREAAQDADIVISMVTDDAASRAVWLDINTGAAVGLRAGAIAIASSTLTIDWTKQLAAEIEHCGAMFLDAPVVGSRPQADAGKLIYLVGGEAKSLTQVRDILSTTSAAIHHVGAVGQGMAMKLAVNTLFGIQVTALAEVLGMLTKTGLTSEQVMDCLGALPIMGPAAKGAGGLMVANNHAPMFPIELVEKDIRYGIETAEAVGATMPVASVIHRVYKEAIAQGYGNDNITGVAQLFI